MHFVETTDRDTGVKDLTKLLTAELKKGKRVLWLVCGGSSIPAEAQIMAALPDEKTQNLSILLTDERYGEVGHVHSNAKQLHDAGFHTKQAIFVPMLEPGFSMEETQERYEQALKHAVEHADTVVGLFGIGADGHIAGILPGSPAVDAPGWIAGYEAPNYTRVTITFEVIRRIDVAYAFVYGAEKATALTKLRDDTLPLAEQPSQILKELPKAYIYNDQIGDK